MYYKTIIIILFLSLFCFTVNANYVTLQSTKAPYELNEVIEFNGGVFLDSNNSGVKGIDLNIIVKDENSLLVDNNKITTNENGLYDINYSYNKAGNYNITVMDLNDGVQTILKLTINDFSQVELEYLDENKRPAFRGGENNVPIKVIAFNSLNERINEVDINIELISEDGSLIDYNSGKTNSLGEFESNFDIPNDAGQYFFLINKGIGLFSFSVFSFKAFIKIVDEDDFPKYSFASTGDNATIKVIVSNFDENVYYSNATVSAKIYDLNNNEIKTISSSDFNNVSGGLFEADLNSSDLNTGTYILKITITKSNTTITKKIEFKVQKYEMNINPLENEDISGKERMPGVFAPGKNVKYNVSFNLIGGEQLSGNDLNYACNKNNYQVKLQEIGTNIINSIDANFIQKENYCEMTIIAPDNPGTYFVHLTGNDVNLGTEKASLQSDSFLLVQNYLIFLDPVNSSTCSIEDGCENKKEFSKAEVIGLQPFVYDLKGNSTVNIIKINKGKIFSNEKKEIDLNSDDLNWNSDYNIIQILPTGNLSKISGGFHPMIALLNIDENNDGIADVNNITAFGFFKLNIFNLTVEAIDVNENSKEDFGPATFKSGETIYFKVTVKDSSNNAVQGAEIKLNSLENTLEFENINVSSVQSQISDANGTAILDLNAISSALTSGEFFGEITITDSSGNSDSIKVFFMVRNYFVHLKAIEDISSCKENMNFDSNNDILFVVEARNPGFWNIINDLNVLSLKVKYLGSIGEFIWPPKDVNITNYSLSGTTCTFDQKPEDINVLTIQKTSNWLDGFYDVIANIDSNQFGSENARGSFQVQPFKFKVMPGPLGETGKPGSYYDFNALAGADVNINAKVIDIENLDELKTQSDINIFRVSDDVLLNNNTGNDLNAGTLTELRIQIPIDASLKDYLIEFKASNKSNKAKAELFLKLKNWKIGIPNKENGGLPKIMLNSDSNIVDDLNDDRGGELISYPKNVIDTGSINYNKISRKGEQENLDWNKSLLVDYNSIHGGTNPLWIDRNEDGNFLNDGNAIYNGEIITDFNSNYFGGSPIITSITGKKITYTTSSLVIGTSFEEFKDTFIGSYEKDSNFLVPITIRDINGDYVHDVNVEIVKVLKNNFGSGKGPELFTNYKTKPFEITSSNTLSLALPTIEINETGSFMLGIKVTKGNQKQVIPPWNGPRININSFETRIGFAREDLNIPLDVNADAEGIDLNAFYYGCFDSNTYYDSNQFLHGVNIGKLVESTYDYDFDLDGNKNKTFYFLNLVDQNTTDEFNACGNGPKNQTLIIDDDTFIDSMARDENISAGDFMIIHSSENEFMFSVCLNEIDCEKKLYDLNALDLNASTLPLYNVIYGNKLKNDANLKEYLLLELIDFDGQYLKEDSIVSGKIFNENDFSTGQLINNKTIKSGKARIEITPELVDGNYLLVLDINNLNSIQTTYFGFEVTS